MSKTKKFIQTLWEVLDNLLFQVKKIGMHFHNYVKHQGFWVDILAFNSDNTLLMQTR